MKIRSLSKALLPACALSALAGCGGGGGGDNPPPPPPNNAPVLTTTSFGAVEDTPFAGQLGASDADGNTFTFARVNDVLHGQLTISTAGAVAYTPAANFSGTDTFSVRVTDSVGAQTTGTVTINVAAVNDAPTFASPALSTDEDMPLDSNVAFYAADADMNTLNFATTAAPAHGTLTMTAGGIALYTPAANFNGADSFSVRVSDNNGGEVTGTVSITVVAVNDAPVLTNGPLSVAEDGVLTAQLTAMDVENQSVLYQVGGDASHGQVTISPSGQLTYTPDANYSGDDGIMVGVSDDGVTVTLRQLAITVNPVNDAPVAFEDLLRLPANAVVALPVLANDSDVDGDSLTLTILSQPGGGTLSISPTKEILFTRDHDFNGPIRFEYRITDAAGLTADAEVRAVIGEFPGIYYLSDETTVGQNEVHWFDGLRVYRIGTDLDAGDEITSFSMAGDGKTVAYVVENAANARVFFTGPSASDSRVIFTGPTQSGSPVHPIVRLNRNGTYLVVYFPFSTCGTNLYMVRVADGLQTCIGGATPNLVQLGFESTFSPVNDDFYIQGQVGGSPPPMSGTGFLTLFRGNAASAATLTQVGTTYPTPSLGGGSGMEIAITAEGRFVLHRELLYSPSVKSSVLVYDSLLNIETPVYRRPVSGEIGMWNGFSLSRDGANVCFLFREPGSGSSGPSRIVAGNPLFPSVAAPVTPVFEYGYDCRFSADNHTLFYWASTAAEPRDQVYAVDTSAPGTPVIANRPLVTGEILENWWVARDGQRQVFGTRLNFAPGSSLYSVSAAAPTTFIPFAANFIDDGSLPGSLDGNGYMLAFSKRPSPGIGLQRLTLLSSQSANYLFSLTRPDATHGLIQYQWAPSTQ